MTSKDDAISRSAVIADLKEWLYRKPRDEFEEGFNNALNGAIERIGNSNVNPALDVAPVDENNPSDKWFVEAYKNSRHMFDPLVSVYTLEAVGPHFQGNPNGLKYDMLIPHGQDIVTVERTFEGIRQWLEENEEEGLVFWKGGEPRCKIKRTDFGFEWPIKEK